MLIQKDKTSLLVIDIQEKLLPAIFAADILLPRCHWLISVAAEHDVPVVFSEQYPKGLGHTAAPLLVAAPGSQVVEKVHFSCVAAACLPEVILKRPQVVVCGIEAHICVLQTVLQLLAFGKSVFVVADAVASRTEQNRDLAIARMRAEGAKIVSREMVLFELMEQSGTDHFRQMSKRYLIGEQPV